MSSECLTILTDQGYPDRLEGLDKNRFEVSLEKASSNHDFLASNFAGAYLFYKESKARALDYLRTVKGLLDREIEISTLERESIRNFIIMVKKDLDSDNIPQDLKNEYHKDVLELLEDLEP